MDYDVLIIGAGVVGAMTARELTRYNLKVALLEKENDVACGASKANSGIIHGGYDPEPGTLKAELNTRGVELLYRAARELNVEHENNGSLVCAFGKEEEPAVWELYRRGQENGIPDLQVLSREEVLAMEPALSETVSLALWVPTAGIICPYGLTIAAAGNAMDNGAQLLRNFCVTQITQTPEGFQVIGGDGRQVRGRYIVNCAGAWADKIAGLIGDNSFTILPRVGEYLLLDKTEGQRVRRTIFQVPTKEGKGILVTPTVDHNLLTGPTASLAAGPEATDTTVPGRNTVVKFAKKSVPGVDFSQVITAFSGIRASEKRGDFILAPSEQNPHFIHAAAIDSPGLTASAAIAEYIVDLLRQQGLVLEENPNFHGCRENPRAFSKLTEEEKDAVIRRDPEFGRILCRCEGVSQGEIRLAIRQNPRALDVDGVKRRTRSGMGRCQGGFCSPFVMKLLAQESGGNLEEVTKKGGGSRIAAGKI